MRTKDREASEGVLMSGICPLRRVGVTDAVYMYPSHALERHEMILELGRISVKLQVGIKEKFNGRHCAELTWVIGGGWTSVSSM